jgi:hypothetical protein
MRFRRSFSFYIILSGVEDSFRALKSELKMRPVYHFKQQRIEGHIFITVLASHLLNAIRFILREKIYFMRWSRVRDGLSTHVVNTVFMKTKAGKSLYIRNANKPEVFHVTFTPASLQTNRSTAVRCSLCRVPGEGFLRQTILHPQSQIHRCESLHFCTQQ